MSTVYPQSVLSKDDGTTYELSGLAAVGEAQEPTATATLSAVASGAGSAQALAANAARKGVIGHNTDANAVYIKYGTTASATSFTVYLGPGQTWVMDSPIYTGRIDAIWAADGAGSLYLTEL